LSEAEVSQRRSPWDFAIANKGTPKVDSTSTEQFATACGAYAPIEVLIEQEDGTAAARGLLDFPFALIGSHEASDIHLNATDIEPIHAFLQVIGGHVFVGDLGSRGGIYWPHGREMYGWLVPEAPVQIGPFRIHLVEAVSPHPAEFGPTFHPLAAGPDVPMGLPKCTIAFRNGQAKRTEWEVNRVLTFIGASQSCKIHLVGKDIAPFHCYLLHTYDGLWVVDLTGGNILVNGEPVRLARLSDNDELQVGEFVIEAKYYEVDAMAEVNDGRISFDVDESSPPLRIPAVHNQTEYDEDLASELIAPNRPLTTEQIEEIITKVTGPSSDLGANFTSGFLQQTPDPIGPELITASASTHAPRVETPLAALQAMAMPAFRPMVFPTIAVPTGDADTSVVPMLKQLGEMQNQMFAQFQQSLMMMMQMFGQMHREQMGAVQSELGRMTELNVELQKLQLEMTKSNAKKEAPVAEPALTSELASNLPAPDDVPAMTEESAENHNWVYERMNQLNEERQSIWQRLFGMLTPKTNGSGAA